MSTQFLGQSAARITVRPRRLGYLVQAGSARDVRKAIEYASSEWGGIGHPIVPVRRRKRIDGAWRQVLEVLKPEVLIDSVGVDPGTLAALTAEIGCSILPAATVMYDEPGVHSLATIPPGSLRGRTLFVPKPSARLIVQAAIGVISPNDELDPLWMDSGAHRATPVGPLDMLDAQLDVPSPIWVTKQQYGAAESELVMAPVMIYTDRSPTLSRLTFFWNVRALAAELWEAQVLWVPLDDLQHPPVIDRIRRLCLNRRHSIPDVVLLGSDDAELDAAASAMGLVHHDSNTSTWRLSSTARDLAKYPLTYWRRKEPRQWFLVDRFVGVQAAIPVVVTRPVTAPPLASPITFNPSIGGRIRVDIKGIDAIEWPQRPETAKLVHDHASWTKGGLGIVTSPARQWDFPLRVVEPTAVLDACLAAARWSWTVSDKGRYANALLGAVAGRSSISALTDPLSLRVVRVLGSLTSKKATQLLRGNLPATLTNEDIDIAVRTVVPALVPRFLTAAEIRQELGRDGTAVSREATLAALDLLLDDQLALRAFRFKCPNCSITTHIPFDAATERVTCRGCTTTSRLRGSLSEPDLTYGLNSLMDRAADQDCHGHLPVQDWMRRQFATIWSVPGADLLSQSGAKREIDVLAVSRSEIVIAEVKNKVSGFGRQQVQDAVRLGADLRADRVVLAALEDWSQEDRAAAEEAISDVGAAATVIGLTDLAPEAPPA